MSFTLQSLAVHADAATFSAELPRRRSDKALEAYLSLDTENRPASYQYEDIQILFPDAARAAELAREAERAVKVDRDPVAAIHLLEDAIRLDQIAALDGDCLVQRAALYAELGQPGPWRALELYQIGVSLSRLNHWKEAEVVYDIATALDEGFLWPANNAAWLLATATSTRAHNGPKSVAAAEWTCANSGWGCWSFLGTLAAAFARENDFERAVAWQRVSLQLTPEPQRHCAEFELGEFERGQPCVDNKRKVSAGADITDEELSQLNVRDLLLKANELITAARTVVH